MLELLKTKDSSSTATKNSLDTTIANQQAISLAKKSKSSETIRSASLDRVRNEDIVRTSAESEANNMLPAGAPMYYDLDPQFRAVTVGPRGAVDLSEIQTTRISLEPIILAVYPKVHVMDVATRRFGILDREQEKAQIEMARLEDNQIFTAFKNQTFTSSSFTDLVNQGVFNALVTGTTGLSPEVAAQAFASVEQFDIPVANVIVNAQQQRDLRLWSHRNYDPVSNCGLN